MSDDKPLTTTEIKALIARARARFPRPRYADDGVIANALADALEQVLAERDTLKWLLGTTLVRLHFWSPQAANEIAVKAELPAPEQPTVPTHAYVPHPKWPWFCKQCGYPEHEILKHAPSEGDR